MKTFIFGNDVVAVVLKKLKDAKKFIKIAVFQIHLDELFDLLECKLEQGITVEIFTLPCDSINDSSVRHNVSKRFEKLLELGAFIRFCKWNVGDPERTSTAIGRWYSFHGKFIVTDRSAIALSANFTRTNELDAAIIIDEEQKMIEQFKNKFDELVNLFITKNYGYEGIIRNKIIETGIENIEEVFKLPNVIQTTTHKDTWIKHYPSSLCPDDIKFEDKLYIVPFDVKGRNVYEKVLNEAEKFIYITAETFTDIDFATFLRQLKIYKNNIAIKILTGSTSMDFSDRIQKMYRELIADEIQLFTIEENLHAKLIITDKHLLLGSINLNKMNLGFFKTQLYWRENTETFYITSDSTLIEEAKEKFEVQITNSINIKKKLAEKIKKEVSYILNKSFNIRSKNEVKELFSKFILMKEIEVKKDANKLARITKKLMNHYKVRIADKNTFLMAVILFYLQDRKHTLSEINNKISRLVDITDITNLCSLIKQLIEAKFIVIEEDFYKINIDTLIE